jgi:hypothetical protein
MAKINCVLGIYESRIAVESAIKGFKDAGFSGSQISVILPDTRTRGSKEMATETDTKAPQSVIVGPGSEVGGSGVGSALGWLVGIGAVTLPGLGPVIAVGPLIVALAGIGIGRGADGFAGSLAALGLPEVDAKRFEQRLLTGEVLVAICCDSAEHFQRAREIMEITHAEDIASHGDLFSKPDSSAA